MKTRDKLVSLAVVAAGVMLAAILASGRKPPAKAQPKGQGPLVEVVRAREASGKVIVKGSGVVRAVRVVQLVPEVSGRVVRISPSLRIGASFKKGELLVQIDPRDYEAKLASARSQLAKAKVQLELAKMESEAAKAEWRAIHGDQPPPSPLVFKMHLVRQAEADLKAAEAQVSLAELALEKTKLVAPFDGVVLEKNCDVGQTVSPGQKVATLVASYPLEVPVPIPERDLSWIQLERKPAAEVICGEGSFKAIWRGRAVRLEAKTEQGTRLPVLVVEVKDPWPVSGQRRQRLLMGSYCTVRVEGRDAAGLVEVPRQAVRPGNVVWIAEGGKLRFVNVDVARISGGRALIRKGVEPGDLLVLSDLAVVTDGMAISWVEAEEEW